MLKIQIPQQIIEQLHIALLRNGEMECGGIMMGEHVGENEFRILDVTIQEQPGSISSFVRNLAGFLTPLCRFFESTNRNYQKFNYIGEWHSHPSFHLTPSSTDRKTMLEIVEDPSVGANFALLMLAKLVDGDIEYKIWSVMAGEKLTEVEILPLGSTYEEVNNQ